MLADGNELQVPFLLKLVEEPFIKPLTYFVKLIVYSNVRHDASVHYSTAAIRKLGPFRTKVDVSLLSLPAIIPDVAEEEIPVVPPYTANAKLPWEDLMLNTLITLPWKRYAVIPTRPLLAHIDIIIKSEFLNRKHGFPIITHLVDHFRQPIDGPPDNVVEEIPATVQQPKVHLIILIHGIDGVGHDMIFLAEKLRDKFKRPNYKISIPTCNDHKTNDGIVAASTRLLAWILEEVEKSNADKISFICHSIGGLYTRFLLKMLMDEQVIPNKLQPVFFITIDTPHLGFQHSSITNTLLSYKWLKPLISPTGCELNLIDNFMTEDGDTHHILEYLTHPDYMEPLRQFQHLVLYGNMYQEGSLYSTYCIGTLQSIPSTIPTKFHQISTVPLATQPVYNDSTEHKMAKALTQLPWKRFTIVPAKTIIPTPPDQYFIDNSDHPLADHILNYLLNNIDRPRSPIQ
ncbi:hypothetical protein HK103_000912 [Boothiomyces macroporosus]|uniref:DUF676 domain-containing protein n=1 Tax=Boothiomyces macroporosus TaxID=261099 RepID=A0AAD5YA13_9FUNG|nr:hypothetical protein HK103_000912 [Boothiomyces macroporosus]